MSTINQKEYLKKYLSIGSEPGKKKKKRKKLNKGVGDRVKIIDDDVDIAATFNAAVEEDLYGTAEDAPQIVGITDDRPLELRANDYKISEMWKPLGKDKSPPPFVDVKLEFPSDDDECNDFNRPISKDKIPKRRERSLSPTCIKNRKSNKDRHQKGDDYSPPRRNNDFSPMARVKQERLSPDSRRNEDTSPPRRRNIEDNSPPRRTRRSSEDTSPPRRRKKSEDASPPRKRRNENDASPQRGRKNSGDSSPRRKRQNSGDKSPFRRRRNSEDTSPPRKRINEDDTSPPRKRRIEDDTSPPRRRRNDEESSPPRKERNNADSSPPRKRKTTEDMSPPRRRNNEDNSPPRRKKNSEDMSPPRRRRNNDDSSPPRKNNNRNDRKNDSDRKRSRWNNSPEVSIKKEPLSPDQSKSSKKMTKTLDGKAAGLQNAKELAKETVAFKKREDELFRKMTAETSGVAAGTIVRDRKTGKIRNLEEEALANKAKEEEDNKRVEKYAVWGKGVKQVEDHNEKIQQDLYEMSKPLARYADDEDLEKYLKDQEREGDPMLAYIRKKKRKKAIEQGQTEKPQYQGEFMPNRYGIRPGHRWDGVDRSNGYEKRWFENINKRKALQEDSYKWNSEDM